MPDVFVSYSHADRDEIGRVAQALAGAGVEVWWDALISAGRWSDQVETALNAAKWVVAFLSPNVIAAESYYVFAEMRRAQSAGKLVPVKIGEFTMSLMIEGVVLGEQMLFAQDYGSFLDGGGLQSLCAMIGQAPSVPRAERAGDPWFDAEPEASQLALAVAVAVAESAPLQTVTDLGQDLERRIAKVIEGSQEQAAPQTLSSVLRSRSSMLRRVGATIYDDRHRRLDVDVACVRFENPNRGQSLLRHIWREFDALRPTLIGWLDHLTQTANADVRQRIGLSIGGLARGDFAPVWDALLRRWIVHEHAATRDVADMALSVAVFDPRIAGVATTLIHDLARSSDTVALRAAVELACGYTGARIKGLPLKILKMVAKSEHGDFKILATMRAAIDFMVQDSCSTDDSSLFDWRQLIGDLAEWAEAPDPETPRHLPTYLFLSLMQGFPLQVPSDGAGSLSLAAIVTSGKTEAGAALLLASARVFAAALRDPGDSIFSPRDVAGDILRSWLRQRAESSARSDAAVDDVLLGFCRAVWSSCATERDRDRLAHALRHAYAADVLA